MLDVLGLDVWAVTSIPFLMHSRFVLLQDVLLTVKMYMAEVFTGSSEQLAFTGLP